MFKRHQLQDAEIVQGSLLTPLQIKVIENRISDLGEELIRTSYNRQDPDFFNKIAECQGQIRELESLIGISELSQKSLDSSIDVNPDSSSNS